MLYVKEVLPHFSIVTLNIKSVKTSWTYSMLGLPVVVVQLENSLRLADTDTVVNQWTQGHIIGERKLANSKR